MGQTGQRFFQLIDLGLDLGSVGLRIGVVSGLNRQFPHALQNLSYFTETTVGRLKQAGRVLGIGIGLGKATNLCTQLARDSATGGIICRTVDP